MSEPLRCAVGIIFYFPLLLVKLACLPFTLLNSFADYSASQVNVWLATGSTHDTMTQEQKRELVKLWLAQQELKQGLSQQELKPPSTKSTIQTDEQLPGGDS